MEKGEEVELKLPDNYFCQLDRQTRSSDGVLCQCRWCELARLSGSAFLSWQRRVKGKEAKEVVRLCQECYAGIFKGSKHVCSASTLEAVQNLTRNLPVNIQDKLALEILRQRQAEKSSSDDSQALFLPPARGGLPIPVLIGQKPAPVPPLPKFSHQELLTMASSAHLTGKQIDTVAADLRAKLGRNVVEAGFDDARVDHNNMYADYFCAEKKLFWDDENNIIEKATFWCHRSKEFLELVARKRNRDLDESQLKIAGDTGKGFLKITASIYTPSATPTQKKGGERERKELQVESDLKTMARG